ncbi:hypothetical protein ACFFTM_10090 [Pseudoduganella plicata]|uniref:Uncharacterized protein n=1 Tax=Pseudoduganella plicata TaxID=321984 RepID=A0A4P7BDG7_9BURK|nr:hypothetical protein [Pseudoduganella plicata]QBQ36193.1 hypothetical protein E1742_08515 [Pseudoduganella plicata]GGY77333.1 hypothetical protein GCM10007388_07650 [Pseudoduganella plicata]
MEYEYRGYTIRSEVYEDPTGGQVRWHCAVEMRPHTGTAPERFTTEEHYATRDEAELGAQRAARDYLDRKLAGLTATHNPQV